VTVAIDRATMVLAFVVTTASMLLPGATKPIQFSARSALPQPAVHDRHANDPRALLLAGLLAGVLSTSPVAAIGPKDLTIGLKINGYAEVECPEALRQGRAGGALGAGAGGAGIAQKCVEVKATATNNSGKPVQDAGVFGVVEDIAGGMSVLGNGQDGKNDAGQFAMIDTIVPGDSEISFIFVAQQDDECVSTRQKKCPVQGTKPLVPLKFEKVKAISYPGGDRYKVYDECEQNEFAEGC